MDNIDIEKIAREAAKRVCLWHKGYDNKELEAFFLSRLREHNFKLPNNRSTIKSITKASRPLLLILLAALLASCSTIEPQRGTCNNKTMHKTVLARITAYWAHGRGTDYNTRRHNGSWVGYGRLKEGVCAVDPKKILYGSKIVYPDGTIDVAGDTGRDVKNRKAARRMGRTVFEKQALVIDKFFETRTAAIDWTKRNPYFMEVKVIPPEFE